MICLDRSKPLHLLPLKLDMGNELTDMGNQEENKMADNICEHDAGVLQDKVVYKAAGEEATWFNEG